MQLNDPKHFDMPLVSIAIPSYNHARFVQQTIQSVIDQDYPNIELIVIDDGSTDTSVTVISNMIPACEQRFQRFSFLHRRNKGLSATLNEALAWAQGEYFSAIASDDVMYPDKTSKLLGYLAHEHDTAAVFSGGDILDVNGTIIATTRCADIVFNFEDIILCRYAIMAPTQLLRLDCIRQVGGYTDGVYIEDWFMWLALSQQGYNLRTIDAVLVGYRQHDLNISKNPVKMLEGRKAILARYRDNQYYNASLALMYMWASIDFTSISKTQSIRYLTAAFRSDKRIALTGIFYECILRIVIPRPAVLWLKKRRQFHHTLAGMIPRSADQASGSGKLMLFTNSIERSPSGGRELLCKLNYDILKDLFGDQLILYEIPKNKLRGWKAVFLAFNGHIDGLTDTHISNALETLRTQNITRIFVDGSGFGGFVKIAKMAHPKTEITTFFHNTEAKFFLGSLRAAKTFRALAIFFANYLAERKSVRYSDKIICLSDRDSQSLKSIYNRGATHISPMAMHDKATGNYDKNIGHSAEHYALFVGSGFYANRAGIQWYLEHVVPRISIKTYFIGQGFDDLKAEFKHHALVEFVGAVDNLEYWYRNALFVIAPIFDGSGMKTKVAEALMFGKKIIGTPEAFSGYQNVANQAGWECTTADDFVTAINEAHNSTAKSYDPTLRAIYENRYSFPAARARMVEILNTTQ